MSTCEQTNSDLWSKTRNHFTASSCSRERELRFPNLSNVQLTPFGRLWKGLCVLPKTLTSPFEDLRQHVILLVHPHELLANDPAEALGVGELTTEAVVDAA